MNKKFYSSVAARFTRSEYLRLLDEAELNNCPKSDIVRKAFADYIARKDLAETLSELETRLVRLIFEIIAVGLDLNNDEKENARCQLNAQGVEL